MIGIDATGVYGDTFGIHNYVGRLVERVLPAAQDQRFTIYCRRSVPGSFRDLHPGVDFRVAPFRKRKICEQVWLPFQLWDSGLSVFHATYGCPVYCPVPLVLTVHDLFVKRYPERYPAWWRAYAQVAIERPASQAAAIVTPSDATRRDVIELLEVSPEKVTTIPLGVDQERFRPLPQEDIDEVRERYGLPDRFFLHVGGFSPVKNTVRIVEAFAQVCREKELSDVCLVFAGKKSWRHSETVEAAQRHGIEDRVIFTGYFPDEDLAALYCAAELFIYPSIIEGFGLPILEAFACDTPVVTSNCTALPEVAGDAAVQIDPESTEMLAENLIRLARQPDERTALAARGRERVQDFTWERMAKKHLEVYQSVSSLLVWKGGTL